MERNNNIIVHIEGSIFLNNNDSIDDFECKFLDFLNNNDYSFFGIDNDENDEEK